MICDSSCVVIYDRSHDYYIYDSSNNIVSLFMTGLM